MYETTMCVTLSNTELVYSEEIQSWISESLWSHFCSQYKALFDVCFCLEAPGPVSVQSVNHALRIEIGPGKCVVTEFHLCALTRLWWLQLHQQCYWFSLTEFTNTVVDTWKKLTYLTCCFFMGYFGVILGSSLGRLISISAFYFGST